MQVSLLLFWILLFISPQILYGDENQHLRDSFYLKTLSNPDDLQILESFAGYLLSNPNWSDEEGYQYASELYRLSEQSGYAYGKAVALNHQGYLLEQSDQRLSVEKYKQALDLSTGNDFIKLKGNILNNLSIVYAERGEYSKSVHYLLQMLSLAEATKDTVRIAVALNNIGLRYLDMNNAELSIGFFRRAVNLNKLSGSDSRFATNLSNMGLAYQMKGLSDSAWYFHRQAIELHRRSNDFYKLQFGYQALAILYYNMGKKEEAWNAFDSAVYLANFVNDQYSLINLKVVKGDLLNREARYADAVSELQSAEMKALEMNYRPILIDLYKELVVSHRRLNQFAQAFDYNEKYLAMRDSLQDTESKKAQSSLMDYEMEKAEREKEFLARENEVQNLTIKRQKLIRNFIILIVFFGFILLTLLWLRFKFIRRTGKELQEKNNIIEIEKQRSDDLLQNILPSEIAKELKQYGSAQVKHYEMVTVMFIDFKGFSQMAELMTPQKLVGEIDYCFKAFDNITDTHKVEKIKTIGDAYMCASGLPVADSANPMKMLLAACEILKFMASYKENRMAENKPFFEARIGIHTGPVIAGIVGHRKFAYDIWGDTVNIASRMETGGETGKINISQTTYEKVNQHYTCTYRGKLETKNKGFLDMYFVDCQK